jgi:hypothetical protein
MSCIYAESDAAYVLGALSPSERREFEGHLHECSECAEAVRQLAGMPGLLGRVSADVLEPPPDEPLPSTLLPSLVSAVRRSRLRRTWVTAGVAAAAAVLATVGTVAVVQRPAGTPEAGPTAPVTPSGVAMTRVGTDPMGATIAFTRVAWGTRLDLTCSYPSLGANYEGGASSYALVVHTAHGSQRVATWRPLPGRTMQLTAATATAPARITEVDVTRADGTPVLALTR